MRRYKFILLVTLLVGCAPQRTDANWPNFTTELSGVKVSISAPQGQFRDVNVPSVDLIANQKPLLLLFQRTWVASGFGSDKGGLELKLLLAKHHAKDANQDFMTAVRLDIKNELAPRFSAEITDPTKRTIGNREWNCYVIKSLRIPDCALELSGDYYLIWRRSWIANSYENPPSEFKELADRVERSIHVAF